MNTYKEILIKELNCSKDKFENDIKNIEASRRMLFVSTINMFTKYKNELRLGQTLMNNIFYIYGKDVYNDIIANNIDCFNINANIKDVLEYIDKNYHNDNYDWNHILMMI